MRDLYSMIEGIEAKGVVKSVQSGVASPPAAANFNITVFPVDPQKCVVFFNGLSRATGDNSSNVSLPYKNELTSTTLTVGQSGRGGNHALPFSWQIIEFY